MSDARLAEALMALTILQQRANSLFDATKHGDAAHQAWLKQAIDNHFAGRPVGRVVLKAEASTNALMTRKRWPILPGDIPEPTGEVCGEDPRMRLKISEWNKTTDERTDDGKERQAEEAWRTEIKG